MIPEKVLVVDDEAEVCEFLSKLFGSEGFDVITARGGGDALKIAKKDKCAVAIVDLNMPGLSGMKLIHKMKKANPDLEVIVYTGYPSVESSVEAIHEHVFDYICKPAESRMLLRVARRAAERRRLILENRDLVRQLKAKSDRLQNQVNVTKRALEHHIEESPEFVGKSDTDKASAQKAVERYRETIYEDMDVRYAISSYPTDGKIPTDLIDTAQLLCEKGLNLEL